MMLKQSYHIENIDITIVTQTSKMLPHINNMKNCLAKILEINQINIKATTTERLGYIGKKEGIATDSVCLLLKK